jgi:Ala-tRNA(Pro) deacylase
MDLQTLYQNNLKLLKESGIIYREVVHEPVLSYEQAKAVRQRFNLSGVESKSLFLKLKDGRYAMFISVEGKRADLKRIRELLGSKPSICSDEELSTKTACIPQCACPFGHSSEIILIVDKAIFKPPTLHLLPWTPRTDNRNRHA